MKKTRLLALVICLAFVFTMAPMASFAEEAAPEPGTGTETVVESYGTITATLRFDYPQRTDLVSTKNINVFLRDENGTLLREAKINGNTSADTVVTLKNTDGVQLTTEQEIGYMDVLFNNLPVNEPVAEGEKESYYVLEYTGDGYKNYTSEPIVIDKYSKRAVLGTDGNTFSLGDVTGDELIDQADIDAISSALGSETAEDIALYDLNGDGKIDIVDLMYVNHQAAQEKGGPGFANEPIEIYDTNLIMTKVIEVKKIQEEMEQTLDVSGDVANLFAENNAETIAFSSKNDEPVAIPITFEEPVEMEQIEIVSPSVTGAITAGLAKVECEDLDTKETFFVEVPFNTETPEEVQPLAADGDTGRSNIVINLGRRVAVKKVTINVEKVEGADGKATFAVVQEIKFLKDIVPENPASQNMAVTGLTAAPGNEKIDFTWDAYPNVTGYIIYYTNTKKPGEGEKQVFFDTNKGTVDGLINLTPYNFCITAVSGDEGPGRWESIRSETITAIPEPSGPPTEKTTMIVVKNSEDDNTVKSGELSVSWKEVDNTSFYRVYYKDTGVLTENPSYRNEDELKAAGYTAYSLTGEEGATDVATLSVTLTGLTNDSEHSIFVIVGNDKGLGPVSDRYTGTPKESKIEFPKLPTKDRLDKKTAITNVWLVDSSYDPNETADGKTFDPKVLYDDNPLTYWQSIQWWQHGGIAFEFDQQYEMNYLFAIPRLDGTYRNNHRLYRVWTYDEAAYNEITSYIDQLKSGNALNEAQRTAMRALATTYTEGSVNVSDRINGYMIFPFDKTNVKFMVVDTEQEAYNVRTFSDFFFYEGNTLAEDIAALFKDDAFTELTDEAKANVDETKGKIANYRSQANNSDGYYVDKDSLLDELSLASLLLNGKSTDGYVKSDFRSRSNGRDSNKFGQSASDLQPLGVACWSGPDAIRADRGKLTDGALVVYAQLPEDADTHPVTLVGTQYYGEANAWQTSVPLNKGRNRIKFPNMGGNSTERGGSVYIRYDGEHPDQIKLHVRGKNATIIPMLELQDWNTMSVEARKAAISAYVTELKDYVTTPPYINNSLDYRILNSTEISMPSVLLSMPASQVKNAIFPTGASDDEAAETLYNNVLAWEEFMHVVNAIQGIDEITFDADKPNVMESRQNIRYMKMFGKAFMYAAGNHVGIGWGSVGGVVTGRPTSTLTDTDESNGLFGWGIGHEVGHNMDKIGRAELTNNIYSIALQAYDGDKSTKLKTRLELSDKYAQVYDKVSARRPGTSNDVFVQLAMYWQLHLAYDEANPFDFYNKFFTAWKKGDYKERTVGAETVAYTPDERIALIASDVANKNLSDFFYSWGMRLSEDVVKAIEAKPAETRSIQYLNDESYRLRLAGHTVAPGATTAAADLLIDLPEAERKPTMPEVAEGETAPEVPEYDIEKTVKITFTNPSADVLGYEIKRNGETIAFVTDGNEYFDVIGSANNMAFEYQVKAYDNMGGILDENLVNAGQVRVAYDKTIPETDYTLETANGTATFTMNAKTAVSGIKVTPAPTEGTFKVEVTRTVAKVDEATGKAGEPETLTLTAKEGAFSADTNLADAGKGYYLTYFNKPGADAADTRIWTYDAETVAVTGVPEGSKVELIGYPGDRVDFYSDATVGILSADYQYGEVYTEEEKAADPTLEDEIIPAGSLVIVGTYRGDPVYNFVQIMGRFVTNDDANTTTPESVVERPVDGYGLLFAEIPTDGEVSDISDGMFIFVPDVQKEAELQDKAGNSDCAAASLLPAQMKAQFYRTDDPENAESKRMTSDTIWIDSPSYESMPAIELAHTN